MHVPFVDLRAQHDELRAEIDASIARLIDTSTFIGGEPVASFEAHFAAYCGTQHAVACANGTDALKLALMACGVRPGHEVITVPHTFIATAEAISLAGAVPVFVDIDGPTYHMDPARLAEFLETRCRRDDDGAPVNRESGRRVAAVLPVHLYGLPADMAPILEIARSYGLPVVEDACQAHGATYGGRRAGALGDAAAFSFYPGKNLGALGEGGAVTTRDARMDRMMRVWRDHGQVERYVHVTPNGWNGRLDSIQCAVLDLKLARLDEWNARRRQVAQWYYELLGGDERIVLPVEPKGRTHVYHLFVVRLPDRERARQDLSERGIGVGLHYPIPLHLQEAYHGMGWGAGDFPESERAAATILSLPMFPHITEAQVEWVCDALIESLDGMPRVRAVGATGLAR
ncbi:MAG TPA: DegT/DnrJ/EryC1/StrS family aminotransferase [Roseiflexaceae bacterium]|nr:DegT/DnrJ/EryC1/StrS family aminotransferase [Roseiflexaceae bacterium]